MRRWLCFLLALLMPFTAMAETIPILVSIGLAEGKLGKVKAAGISQRAPWGIHHADVIYESLLYEGGQTRLLALFSSEYPSSVGPVRSARASHFLTREEWNGALIFSGDASWIAREALIAQGLDMQNPLLLNHHSSALLRSCAKREKGVKAPDNLSVDLAALRSALSLKQEQYPLRFGNPITTGSPCTCVTLDWGHTSYRTSFEYKDGRYRCARNGSPFLSYDDAQKTGNGTQLAFSSVIIQYVRYDFPSQVVPLMQVTGQGKADYLIGGRKLCGSWIRGAISGQTVYLDANGQEMHFPQGKVYIAQFPEERSVLFHP